MNTVLRTTEELCSEKFQNTDSLKKCIMTTVLFSNFVKQVIALIELTFYSNTHNIRLYQDSTASSQYHLQTTIKSFRFRCQPRNSDNWSGLWEHWDYAEIITFTCMKNPVCLQLKIGRFASFKAYRMYHATDTCRKKWRLTLFHVLSSEK